MIKGYHGYDEVQDRIDNVVHLTEVKMTQVVTEKHVSKEIGYDLDCQKKLLEKEIVKALTTIKEKEKKYLSMVNNNLKSF